jgi:hypothetical protein
MRTRTMKKMMMRRLVLLPLRRHRRQKARKTKAGHVAQLLRRQMQHSNKRAIGKPDWKENFNDLFLDSLDL